MPFLKPVPSQKGLVHSNDFRTFFINRDGIEVVDLLIESGRTGCAMGPASSGNWNLTQRADIFDTFDGAAESLPVRSAENS